MVSDWDDTGATPPMSGQVTVTVTRHTRLVGGIRARVVHDVVKQDGHVVARTLAHNAELPDPDLTFETDWREWIRRRPGTWLLGGFALGLYLGSRRR